MIVSLEILAAGMPLVGQPQPADKTLFVNRVRGSLVGGLFAAPRAETNVAVVHDFMDNPVFINDVGAHFILRLGIFTSHARRHDWGCRRARTWNLGHIESANSPRISRLIKLGRPHFCVESKLRTPGTLKSTVDLTTD